MNAPPTKEETYLDGAVLDVEMTCSPSETRAVQRFTFLVESHHPRFVETSAAGNDQLPSPLLQQRIVLHPQVNYYKLVYIIISKHIYKNIIHRP